MPHPGRPQSDDEVRGFFDRWIGFGNSGAWDQIAALMHEDIVITDPMSPQAARGRPQALQRVRDQYEPFPDGAIELVAGPFAALDGPELAYRWRFTGTHLRPVDPPGFAPTGRRVEVDGVSVLRFLDGRVVAVELFFDSTAVARQLLAAPPAGSPLESVIALGQRVRVRIARATTNRRGRITG